MDKIAIVIPARIASSRFPSKMLCDVGGETLIERVYRICKTVHSHVYVATDSTKIRDLIGRENVVMTPESCPNGTARIYEAAKKLHQYSFFVNVQGDMVDPPVKAIKELVRMVPIKRLLTVCTEMPKEMQNDPNTVKCVVSNHSQSIWFARGMTGYGEWHLGLYAYTRSMLNDYMKLPVCEEEKIESLEQLRFCKNGYTFSIIKTDEKCNEINTPEDLNKWLSTQ